MPRFQVFQTDADFSQEPENMRFQSNSFDISETVACTLFVKHYPCQDFMVYDTEQKDVLLPLLTPNTLRLRGEV